MAKINGIEDLREFLNPSVSDIHSPYLLKNVDLLVERIIGSIKNKQKIVIFGDCDWDGIASGVTLYKYLLNFTDNVELKFVERSVGHGTKFVMDQIPDDTKLYIAVDSSSNDVEEMKFLSSKGIDCLIIDHHTVTVENPYSILVNPQQPGCSYPNKNSCGGLLVYKVCQVIDDYMNTDYTEDFSDLPGFALMADMMSMREPENRYYARYSLANIKHEGLKALFVAMNKDINNLISTDFSYAVAPAITAATRLDNIQLAVNLLMLHESCPEIKPIVKSLVQANEYRKEVQWLALQRLKPSVNVSDKTATVYDPTLGKGMNGLVAQELSKHFNKPAIVLGDGEEEDVGAGSFRGLEEFSMLDMLNECQAIIFAAGHDGAGGLVVNKQDVESLKHELNIRLKDFVPDDTLYYDLDFDVNEVNERLIDQINDFYRVCGRGFEAGNFLIKGLFVENKKPMGRLNNTVKVFCDNMHLMKFKADEDYYNNFPVYSFVEAIGKLNINIWKEYKPRFKITKTKQLLIEDYRNTDR
ncbi:DHH family phosphoesterase [Paenibacillus sp. JSM ZJ436]|uniref:DHH family phosphoesterase n=1 Tax=Paenibacillus sp. JSM ZJ436 TaxID=3376190 RepID=UPI00378AAFBC